MATKMKQENWARTTVCLSLVKVMFCTFLKINVPNAKPFLTHFIANETIKCIFENDCCMGCNVQLLSMFMFVLRIRWTLLALFCPIYLWLLVLLLLVLRYSYYHYTVIYDGYLTVIERRESMLLQIDCFQFTRYQQLQQQEKTAAIFKY